LSRLASKRKSRNVTKDEADTATGAAVGTTAVVTDDPTETRKSSEVPEAARSSAEDVEVVGAPISPVHTKDSAAPKTAKPNLERHITNIETSSESESDTDEDRARKREKKQKSAILGGTNTVRSDDNEDFASANEAEAPFVIIPARTRSIGNAGVAPTTASTEATKSIDDTALPNENSSTVATKSIAERAVSSPIEAPIETPVSVPVSAPRESTASSRPDVEKEKAQESKRSRGFFSMFKNRQSSKAAERQPGSFSGTSGKSAVAKETTTTVPAATAMAGSSDPRAVSPSSFNRHGSTDSDVPAKGKKPLDLSDVSSLSSSGLDEDDLQDGRTGRMTRPLGSKKTKTIDAQGLPTTGAGQGIRSDDDDSDQFEEARDHFDEGLAPHPSFGGQAKSSSPARETRFKEEV
jgi:riboflavin biosynthesis pyrimidine reductase